MINDSHKQFLLERAGADKVRHSGRTLFAHLVGTHDLLQAWGNSEPVRTAGLFHSIYGTQKFQHRSWPVEERATIQALIGRDAELLAYVFCRADRPKEFIEALVKVVPATKMLRQLLEIEAANLLDQRSKSRWLPQLRQTEISDAAKHAIDQYLHSNARAA